MQQTVRPAYKQTGVGMIPEDWDAVRVDQIGVVRGGKRLPLGRSLTERRTPHPYLRVSDMKNGSVEVDTVLFVPEDVAPTIRNYRISANDIYMSVAGTLGLVGVVPKSLDGANLTENADKITDLKCNRDFLYFCLSSARIQSEIYAKRTVGAQPKLAIQQIEAFEIALPPSIDEQRAIAEALSDADAWIAGLEAVIAKKGDLKQAAMQLLLTGETRLPGFSGEWEVKRLGEIFELTMAGSKSNYVEDSGAFWVVDMGSVTRDGRLSVTKPTNISADMLYEGDLVMPKDDIGGGNIIGRVGYIDQSKKYVCGDHVYRLSIKAGAPKFFCYLINSDPINKALRKKVVGSAQLGLGRKSVLDQELAFPSPVEQTAIAEIFSDMDADLATLEAQAAKARSIKQGLMQTLLTGQVRLV